jgi:hypothetical protein
LQVSLAITMTVQGHAASKFVTGRQLASSSGRGWTNMLAERWSHAVGELTPVLTRDTEVAVLLSGGTLVERQGNGLRQTTLGQRGSLWIVPSGMREDFVSIQRPAHDCLHIFLPAKPFADCILQDLDIDPARVKLRYEAVSCEDRIVDGLFLPVEFRACFSPSERYDSRWLPSYVPAHPTLARRGLGAFRRLGIKTSSLREARLPPAHQPTKATGLRCAPCKRDV